MLSRKGFPVGPREESLAGEQESGEDPSALEALQGASVQGRLGLAEGARKVLMVGGRLDEHDEPSPYSEKPFCRNSGDGFNIEAGTRVRAGES